MSEKISSGKTTLTPDVLLTIARMSALEVEGVKCMAPVKSSINSLFRKDHEGVRVVIEDEQVLVDLYLIMGTDVNLREVGRTVQHVVARAIAEMTGLEVGHVNIHIEDIDYGEEA